MKKLVISLVLLLVANFASSQDTGPGAAMLLYADAAKSWDAARIAELMHPDALRRTREAFDGALVGENRERARTELLPAFLVSSYEEFTVLSDTEVFQRLNEAVAEAAPGLVDLMADSEYEVIGQIERGDEVFLTYILTMSIEEQEIQKEVVQRLKQHEGEWLLMLPPDGEATIAGIEAEY